jgi:acetoin utilization deacetylase AcuC-like enzyme
MASAYRDRPWLRLYQTGKPADITREHSDALSMWRSGLARSGDRPFLYYFDTPVTAEVVEAESDALGAAITAFTAMANDPTVTECDRTSTAARPCGHTSASGRGRRRRRTS